MQNHNLALLNHNIFVIRLNILSWLLFIYSDENILFKRRYLAKKNANRLRIQFKHHIIMELSEILYAVYFPKLPNQKI